MKIWKKPYVAEVESKLLSLYIQAAARSGICIGNFGR